ncbi:MAG TPA: PaaI family thioesterase [Roseiarcus sp.]|nr:PaaI family thioesterase [Roseiarcus sp.]
MLTTASRAYGVADPAEARLVTGREFLQAIIDGQLPAPPIAKTLTFWLTEIGDGFAVFEGEAGPHLLNPLGIVHGGWAMTLIDSAAGCAAHSLLPAGASYATIETKANFSRPIAEDSGRVRAEGRAIGRGRRIISCEARVVDAKGRLLAHGTSTLMVLDVSAPTRPAPEAA